MGNEINKQGLTDQEIVRREKVKKLQELGIDPFGQAYEVTAKSSDIKEKYKGYTHEELEAMNVEVSVAGRIMFLRKMGKASFFAIQDIKGKQQVYISRDSVGEETYALFKMADIGDIVGAKELVTGTTMQKPIAKKIVTIEKNTIKITHKVGE